MKIFYTVSGCKSIKSYWILDRIRQQLLNTGFVVWDEFQDVTRLRDFIVFE